MRGNRARVAVDALFEHTLPITAHPVWFPVTTACAKELLLFFRIDTRTPFGHLILKYSPCWSIHKHKVWFRSSWPNRMHSFSLLVQVVSVVDDQFVTLLDGLSCDEVKGVSITCWPVSDVVRLWVVV